MSYVTLEKVEAIKMHVAALLGALEVAEADEEPLYRDVVSLHIRKLAALTNVRT